MNITRRKFLLGASTIALLSTVLTLAGGLGGLIPAHAQTASSAELMAPGPLPEQALGKSDAPVTVIEYASMTCPHCADFHASTYPELKKRYIDTGKVRFIFREFPLDPLATAGFMLARCAGEDKYFPMIELLFATQRQWAVKNPVDPLFNTVKQAGFTKESFTQCLDTKNNAASRKMWEDLEKVRERGAKLGVNSTPTFFINGKMHRGGASIEELDKLIQAQIKS